MTWFLHLLLAQWLFLPALSEFLGLYESMCSSEFDYILAIDLLNYGEFHLNGGLLTSEHLTPNHQQLVIENTLHQISQPFYFNSSIEVELDYIGPDVECPKLLQIYSLGMQAVYVDSMNTSFSTVDISQPYLSNAFAFSQVLHNTTMIDIIGLQHKNSNYSLSWTRLQNIRKKVELSFTTEITNVSVPSKPLDIQFLKGTNDHPETLVFILYQQSIEIYRMDPDTHVFILYWKIDITDFFGEKAFRFLYAEREMRIIYFLTDNLLVSLEVDLIGYIDAEIQFDMTTIDVLKLEDFPSEDGVAFKKEETTGLESNLEFLGRSQSKESRQNAIQASVKDIQVPFADLLADAVGIKVERLTSFGVCKNNQTSFSSLIIFKKHNFSCIIPFSRHSQAFEGNYECLPLTYPSDFSASRFTSSNYTATVFGHYQVANNSQPLGVGLVYSTNFYFNTGPPFTWDIAYESAFFDFYGIKEIYFNPLSFVALNLTTNSSSNLSGILDQRPYSLPIQGGSEVNHLYWNILSFENWQKGSGGTQGVVRQLNFTQFLYLKKEFSAHFQNSLDVQIEVDAVDGSSLKDHNVNKYSYLLEPGSLSNLIDKGTEISLLFLFCCGFGCCLICYLRNQKKKREAIEKEKNERENENIRENMFPEFQNNYKTAPMAYGNFNPLDFLPPSDFRKASVGSNYYPPEAQN